MIEHHARVKTIVSKLTAFALSLSFAFGTLGLTHGAAYTQPASSAYHSSKLASMQTNEDSRTTWSFAQGSAGWTTVNLGKGRPDGAGRFYPLTGGAPQVISPDLNIPLDGYNTIEIKVALAKGTGDPTMRVFFATEDQRKFSQDRSDWLTLKPDGITRTYRIYFGTHPDWKGLLTKLRLAPAGAGDKGGVRIERISLLNDTPPAVGPSFP